MVGFLHLIDVARLIDDVQVFLSQLFEVGNPVGQLFQWSHVVVVEGFFRQQCGFLLLSSAKIGIYFGMTKRRRI